MDSWTWGNLKRELVVLLFVLVSSDPPLVLFLLFLLYGASGYLLWFWRWRRGATGRRHESASIEDDPDES